MKALFRTIPLVGARLYGGLTRPVQTAMNLGPMVTRPEHAVVVLAQLAGAVGAARCPEPTADVMRALIAFATALLTPTKHNELLLTQCVLAWSALMRQGTLVAYEPVFSALLAVEEVQSLVESNPSAGALSVEALSRLNPHT